MRCQVIALPWPGWSFFIFPCKEHLFQIFSCWETWGCVKTLVPSEPQNSWLMNVYSPNMVIIGFDPSPHGLFHSTFQVVADPSFPFPWSSKVDPVDPADEKAGTHFLLSEVSLTASRTSRATSVCWSCGAFKDGGESMCLHIYIRIYIYIWEFITISGSSTTIRTGKLWSASTNMIQIKMLMIINYHLWIIKHLWIRIINICTGNYGKIIESGPSIASWSSFSLAHK